MKFQINSRFIARQAAIATLYTVLTLSGFGLSYGPIQFRFSEVLTWLAFYDPKNIFGLTLGCFLSNMTSPYGIIDMVIGSLGTFLAVSLMAKSKSRPLASIWPAVFSFLYSGEALFLGEITPNLFPIVTLQIMVSQLIIVAVIGLPMISFLEKNTRFTEVIIDPTMPPTKEARIYSPHRL